MAQTSEFLPQWTSPPGQTIADLLEAKGLSGTDFVRLLEEPATFVDGLLEGRVSITLGLAKRLQDILGGSVVFWMTRDRQYRDDVMRLRATGLAWLRELPLLDMTRSGWIAADSPDGFEVESLLRYFAVPSVSAWRAKYAAVLEEAAFRTSPTFTSKPGSVAAWLRQGERIGEGIACDPWNRDSFARALIELRRLTRVGNPRRFIPKLQEAGARCGVAIVVLQAPSGCRASGAVCWLSREKPLVLLSSRHLSDDHFWFTLYHECAHLLLHSGTQVFLDEDIDTVATLEQEANRFASEMLIPPQFEKALASVRPETFAVVRLAMEIGIAPGILVAQMQRLNRLEPNQLNRLKRRYKWEDGQLVTREKP
jgi:Zn-dependent peptidase ImmA (M78 family)/plasmid maintenance system antidote protein VapI